jgi:hypothetical protein
LYLNGIEVTSTADEINRLDGGSFTQNNLTVLTNASVGGALTVTGDATIRGGDITGANTNTIDLGEVANGTVTFGRPDAGTVVLTAVDSDANAALTIEAGGNGALKLGATDSTTEISSSDWTISTGVKWMRLS